MVYCGKPSKGCGHCRSRKIRCDQARPACSQCIRAKRDCPGYRDQLSLMFRDESKSVVQKATEHTADSNTVKSKRTPSRSPRTASPNGNPDPEPAGSGQLATFDFNADPLLPPAVRQAWQLPLEIHPPLEPSQEEAICFYLRANAIPGSFWVGDFVTKFLMESGGPSSKKAMQASMTAVASAMLCRLRIAESLRLVARKEYVSALTLLNTALADSEEAKTNQTLGAVVLLAVYEIVTTRSASDIELWTNHISGATALLELRGTDQLKTEAGLRLFMHLRYQIIISCIQRGAHVPKSLLECSKLAMYLRPAEAYSNSLIIIIGKLSNLRADIKAKTFTNEQEILSAASIIEAELIAWLAALPPDFTYEIQTRNPYDFLFQERCRGLAPYDDQYHVYPSLFICNMWNQYRSARIIVSEILLSQILQLSDSSSLRSLSDEFRLQCQALQTTIRRLAVDVTRSVPYHLCAHLDFAPTCPPPESYLGGLMLLWPLFLAGVAERRGHPLRRWVMECLKMIGNTMGLDQALALVDIVSADPGILQCVTEEGESRVWEEPNAPSWSIMAAKKHSVASIMSDSPELSSPTEIGQ